MKSESPRSLRKSRRATPSDAAVSRPRGRQPRKTAIKRVAEEIVKEPEVLQHNQLEGNSQFFKHAQMPFGMKQDQSFRRIVSKESTGMYPGIKPKEVVGGSPSVVNEALYNTISPQKIQPGTRKRSKSVLVPKTTDTADRGAVKQRSFSIPNIPMPAQVQFRTEEQISDYKRRKMMQLAYTRLEQVVPRAFFEKPTRVNILNGAIEYISFLQQIILQRKQQEKK